MGWGCSHEREAGCGGCGEAAHHVHGVQQEVPLVGADQQPDAVSAQVVKGGLFLNPPYSAAKNIVAMLSMASKRMMKSLLNLLSSIS